MENWCSVVEICNAEREDEMANGTTNHSNISCPGYPFCVKMLTSTIDHTHMRLYDLFLAFGNVVFLAVLFIHMVPTVKKLSHSLPLFKILYSLVFVIPAISLVHGIISMSLGYKDKASKLTHVVVRGSILLTEMCVIVFGLFFKSYADQMMKIWFTLLAVFLLSAVFTIGEGAAEWFDIDKKLVCHDLGLFTHGGMIFLFTTSIIFSTVYFLIYLMYLLGLSKRWGFPSKKSFYRYALVLSMINLLQAIGSMLWYTGKHTKTGGSTGICLTSITNFIYLTTFAPVVYWIFLKNYFRMNKPANTEQRVENAVINAPDESPPNPRRKSTTSIIFSKPYPFSKRSSYFEEQRMLEGDLDSSVSSYGSLRDEEIFSRLDK